MIKINLVREGRAVRGTGAPAGAAVGGPAAPANINSILIIALIAIGVLLAGGYWFITNRQLSEKEEAVASRKKSAADLEAVIKDVEKFQAQKDNLQKRIDLINQLKQNQKGPVRIMDRISQDLPDLVWLDKMTIDQGRIALGGRGLNPNAIANFIANIKNDPYFEEPNVGSVAKISDTPLVYGFDMDFAFTYVPKVPGAPAAGGETSTAGTTSTAAPGGAKQ